MKSVEILLKEAIERFDEVQDKAYRAQVRRLEHGSGGRTRRFKPPTMETRLQVAESVLGGKVQLEEIRESAPIRRNNGGYGPVDESQKARQESDELLYRRLGLTEAQRDKLRGTIPQKVREAGPLAEADYKFLRALGFHEADATRGAVENVCRDTSAESRRRRRMITEVD